MALLQDNWPLMVAVAAAAYFGLQKMRAARPAAEPEPFTPAPMPPAVETASRELTHQDIRTLALDAMSKAERHGKVCLFIEIVNEAKPLFDCEGKGDTPAAE